MPRSVMSLTRAVTPTLSRFCDEVWFTCPELHAESATGAMSRTPIAAARRARFTVHDLQGVERGPDARGARAAYRPPPVLRPEGRAFPVAAGPADGEGSRRREWHAHGPVVRRRPRRGPGRGRLGVRGALPRPRALG